MVALWTALWSLVAGSNHSWGAYLGVLAVLVLAGAAAAGPLVPALQAPLLTDKPAAPQGYQPAVGGYPGAGQGYPQQGGYGFPAPGVGQPGQPGQPLPGQQGPGMTFGGGQPQQQGGYGFPAPGAGQPGQPLPGQPGLGQPTPDFGYGQPNPAAAQPQDAGAFAPAAAQAAPAPAPAAAQSAPVAAQAPAPEPTPAAQAPAADFAPFWFAVPEPRRLAPKDGSAGPPVGELLPGTWYLAVDQRGSALIAQLQDGSQGLLPDSTGIQRG